jgi:hypothetical protein
MYDEVRLTNYLRQELISSLSRAHCGMTEIKLIQAESAELAGFAGLGNESSFQVYRIASRPGMDPDRGCWSTRQITAEPRRDLSRCTSHRWRCAS